MARKCQNKDTNTTISSLSADQSAELAGGNIVIFARACFDPKLQIIIGLEFAHNPRQVALLWVASSGKTTCMSSEWQI